MILPLQFGCGRMAQRVCRGCQRQLPQLASQQQFYELLGVAPDASAAEIESAYLRQMRTCAADPAVFDALSAALSTLSDPQLRANYDASLDHIRCVQREARTLHNATSCKLCLTPFNAIKRRHHCRRCGRSVCGECSPHRRPLPSRGYDDDVRHCALCEQEVSTGGAPPKDMFTFAGAARSPPRGATSPGAAAGGGEPSADEILSQLHLDAAVYAPVPCADAAASALSDAEISEPGGGGASGSGGGGGGTGGGAGGAGGGVEPPSASEMIPPTVKLAYPLEVGFASSAVNVPSAVAGRLFRWGLTATRRYSDFVWLHRQLCEEGFPSQILPRLPGKLLLVPRLDEDADTDDNAALLRRQGELGVYLRALLVLPQLRTSLAIKLFLSEGGPYRTATTAPAGGARPGGRPPGLTPSPSAATEDPPIPRPSLTAAISAAASAAASGDFSSVAATALALLDAHRRPPPPAEMLSLPTVENWVRFRAEQRFVTHALSELGQREARATVRQVDGAQRAKAREMRSRRWRDDEEKRSSARLAALASRTPSLRRAVAVAAERLRLQRNTVRLLQLPGLGASMGSLEEQLQRTVETTAFEALRSLVETWDDAVQLEADVCRAEEHEWEADQRRWDSEESDWMMRNASWWVEIHPEAPPPASVELLEQRGKLEVRARWAVCCIRSPVALGWSSGRAPPTTSVSTCPAFIPPCASVCPCLHPPCLSLPCLASPRPRPWSRDSRVVRVPLCSRCSRRSSRRSSRRAVSRRCTRASRRC